MIGIIIDNFIRINKYKLSDLHIKAIKDKFTYSNNQYYQLKAIGKKVSEYMKTIRSYWESQDGQWLYLSRGLVSQLEGLLKEWGIEYYFEDNRVKKQNINIMINPDLELRKYNKRAFSELEQYENAILIAPPGAGKTKVMVSLIAKLQQPTLIIVHTSAIYKHWIKEIKENLIYNSKIGEITAGKYDLYPITVSTIQTLDHLTWNDYEVLNSYFGNVIIDECHHLSAFVFNRVINRFKSFYRFGSTASYTRKDKKEVLFFNTISHNIVEVKEQELIDEDKFVPVQVYPIYLSGFKWEFKNDFVEMVSELSINEYRNKIIIKKVIEDSKKYNVLVFVDRKEHCRELYEKINNLVPCCMLTSKISNKKRDKIVKDIVEDKIKILIATSSLIGEGADIPILNCLHLIMPSNNYELLRQRVGRIRRVYEGKKEAILRDYIDDDCTYLSNIGKKRLGYYKKMGLEIMK
jgi:superfamily II DNA or RNA helicase